MEFGSFGVLPAMMKLLGTAIAAVIQRLTATLILLISRYQQGMVGQAGQVRQGT
jgi:hypothetical protein